MGSTRQKRTIGDENAGVKLNHRAKGMLGGRQMLLNCRQYNDAHLKRHGGRWYRLKQRLGGLCVCGSVDSLTGMKHEYQRLVLPVIGFQYGCVEQSRVRVAQQRRLNHQTAHGKRQ